MELRMPGWIWCLWKKWKGLVEQVNDTYKCSPRSRAVSESEYDGSWRNMDDISQSFARIKCHKTHLAPLSYVIKRTSSSHRFYSRRKQAVGRMARAVDWTDQLAGPIAFSTPCLVHIHHRCTSPWTLARPYGFSHMRVNSQSGVTFLIQDNHE